MFQSKVPLIFHPPGSHIYQLLFANCQLKDSAFAAVTCDGHVVTWGGRHGFGRGGNSLAVQRQLVDVQRLSATDGAFAALLGDGRVPWKPMIFSVFFCCFFFFEKSLHTEKWGGFFFFFGGWGLFKELFFFLFLWVKSRRKIRRVVPRQEEGDPQNVSVSDPQSLTPWTFPFQDVGSWQA